MNEAIVFQILPYALTAAGLILCLGLFLSAKREVRRLQRQAQERQESLELSVRDVRQAFEQVQEESLRQAAQPSTPPPASGINLTRRAQALRMHRRGENAASIAAALGVPRNEIELLLKFNRLGGAAC